MKTYRVLLALDLGDGVVHQHGERIELDAEQAALYSHALMACDEEEGPADGGNS